MATVQSAAVLPQPFGELTLSLNSTWWDSLSGKAVDPSPVATIASGSSTSTEPGSSRPDEAIWIVETDSADDAAAPASGDDRARIATTHPSARTPASSETPSLAARPLWIPHVRFALFAVPLVVAALVVLWTLGRCLRQSIVFRRRLAGCREIYDGKARWLLDKLCAEFPRSRRIRLLSSADDPEPAAFGLRQWTIVLPERAERDLAEDELRALLAHEVAHLVRGDVAWLGVWRVVCSCLAFQPLNQVARREWQRAAEWLCDNWAVSRTGSRLALARCLTEVAGWRLGPTACAPSLGATGANGGLSSRIERLIDEAPLEDNDFRSSPRRRLAVAGGLILVALVCCAPRISLSMPKSAGTPGDRGTLVSDPAPQAAPQSDLDFQFVVQPVHEAEARVRVEATGPGEFAELDREWSALVAELAALEPLLQRKSLTEEERPLAERLAKQIAALKSRHAELGRIREQLKQSAPSRSLSKP